MLSPGGFIGVSSEGRFLIIDITIMKVLSRTFLVFCCLLSLSAASLAQVGGNSPRLQTRAVSENMLRQRLSDWMSLLPDSTSFISLFIPATHDAATDAFISLSASRQKGLQCQSGDFESQFAAGARGYDVRVGDDLRLYHSSAATVHTFDGLLVTINELLDNHPTETLVMLLKRENGAQGKYSQWLQAVASHLNKKLGKRLFNGLTPETTLGELRGKCVLISRENFDSDTSTKGLMKAGGFATWTDNPKRSTETFTNYHSTLKPLTFVLQDCYKEIDCNGKAQLAEEGMKESEKLLENRVATILYTSLAGRPADNARVINPAVLSFLRSTSAPRCHGLLFMDFLNSKDEKAGEQLALAIIAQNFKSSR